MRDRRKRIYTAAGIDTPHANRTMPQVTACRLKPSTVSRSRSAGSIGVSGRGWSPGRARDAGQETTMKRATPHQAQAPKQPQMRHPINAQTDRTECRFAGVGLTEPGKAIPTSFWVVETLRHPWRVAPQQCPILGSIRGQARGIMAVEGVKEPGHVAGQGHRPDALRFHPVRIANACTRSIGGCRSRHRSSRGSVPRPSPKNASQVIAYSRASRETPEERAS